MRIATTLSLLSRRPIRVVNIRAKRSNPGLRPQHLHALRACAEAGYGELTGDWEGSTEVAVHPNWPEMRALPSDRHLHFDIGTAGSCTLLIQAVLPLLVFQEGTHTLCVRGGTDVPMAPPSCYLRDALLPVLENAFGMRAEVEVRRWGFYPQGGGEMVVTARGLSRDASLPGIHLMGTPHLSRASVFAFSSGKVPRRVLSFWSVLKACE